MPSVLRLDRDRVGPSEPVRLTRLDQSIDFTDPSVRTQLFVALSVPRSSASSGTITILVPNWSVIGPDELEFRIDRVGALRRGLTPPGTYEVFARVGALWQGDGNRPLHVQATPTPARVASLSPPLTIPTRIRLSSLRATLALRLLPTAIRSSVRFAYNRVMRGLMGLAMRNPRIFPMVPGGGPGPPGAGGPGAGGGVAGAPGGGGRGGPVPPRGPVGFLRPFRDGSEGFPAIHRLVDSANLVCFLATWGFDESIRWSATGQNDTGTPTAAEHVKAQAVDMARLAESRVQPRTRPSVYSNIRVLLWDKTLDWDYGGNGNDVGNIGMSWVRWNDVRGLRPARVGPVLRQRGVTGESWRVLARVHEHYLRLRNPDIDMPYPSGVMVTTQNHSTASVLGSHHQKFLLTEDAAYVGGLNFLKEYWDTPGHDHGQPGRESSGGVGSGGSGSGSGPLHDTGALLRSEDCQRSLLRMFASRWDQAIARNGPFEGLVDRLFVMRNRTNERQDRMVYDSLIRYLRSVPRTLTGSRWMSIGFSSSPIPTAGVDDIRITYSLPRGTAWAGAGGVTETLREYRTALGRTGGPQSTVLIETQYFQDPRVARRLLERWLTVGAAREAPYAHIVIPYVPDTHWADISIPGLRESEFDRVVTAEFQNLRWLELRTMTTLLTEDSAGQWQEAFSVGDPVRDVKILGGAHDDPTLLTPDQYVEIANAVDVATQVVVPSLQRRIGDIMTKSQIVGYSLAMDEVAPSGSDARERQRGFLEEHGVYVHSKAATFIDEADGAADWATVGSANLNPRSLEEPGAEQDSESNVWWTSAEGPRRYFLELAAEHLVESDPDTVHSRRLQHEGLEALNRIRAGRAPGRHLVRLDVADRLTHLV